jgi:hypothetical protein
MKNFAKLHLTVLHKLRESMLLITDAGEKYDVYKVRPRYWTITHCWP